MTDEVRNPGWYPDPDGGAGERWFNGAGWSDSRRGVPVIYSAENPAPQLPGQVTMPTAAVTINARVNPLAFYSIVAGGIGLFFNVFFVPSILAIVFASRGLARASQLQAAGETATLKTMAIIGLVLGILGIAGGFFQLILFIIGFVSSISVSAA